MLLEPLYVVSFYFLSVWFLSQEVVLQQSPCTVGFLLRTLSPGPPQREGVREAWVTETNALCQGNICPKLEMETGCGSMEHKAV